MAELSNYLSDELLNHILRNTPYTSPGTDVYLALYTNSQGDDDSGTEAARANGYARVAVTVYDAPVDGVTANTNEIDFGTASGGNWGTITSIGLKDSSTTSGTDNLLMFSDLDSPKVVNDGDGFKIAAGDLDVTLL